MKTSDFQKHYDEAIRYARWIAIHYGAAGGPAWNQWLDTALKKVADTNKLYRWALLCILMLAWFDTTYAPLKGDFRCPMCHYFHGPIRFASIPFHRSCIVLSSAASTRKTFERELRREMTIRLEMPFIKLMGKQS